MNYARRWISAILVLTLVFSLCTSAFAVDTETELTDSGKLRSSLQKTSVNTAMRSDGQYKAGDQVRVVVLMDSKPTAERLSVTSRLSDADRKLMSEHTAVQNRMSEENVDFTVNFEYTALLNGMSVTMDYADLDKVASIPNVKDVVICREYRIPETQPNASSASEMISANLMTRQFGADGSGKLIAVLDTGITAGHEAFRVYDGMLQTPAYDSDGMEQAISQLGHGNYVSQKIPFQFDYADGDNDATDDSSGHGSHVSGIAAGYVATSEGEILFRGSAPDAQILAMKIFSSASSTTSTDIYFAALEDAFKLGADVINLSIGAPAGFVEDAESVLNERIFERLEEAGIIVCCAAGNEGTLGAYSSNLMNQQYGTSYVMGSNADYGLLGSPASYNGNVAVASLENAEYPAYNITVGEEKFPYSDTNGTSFLDAFGGQDLEYVVVPNIGASEDYEGLDVAGKITLVTRGENTFVEKIANAAAAGAAGVVVCNNTTGMINMAVEAESIPAIFVDYDAGEAMKALETKMFHVDEEMVVQDNPDAWSMSSFSSWGPTNDLKIKPSITGVGGNVYSVAYGTEDGYEVMSGTSMSAPNVSGGYATLLEALSKAYPDMSKSELADLARSRTLSSARVLMGYYEQDYDGVTRGVPYSPRQQGAGLMDLAAAYLTQLTITDPLVELGDHEDGIFTITAELQNTADTERTYAISADVITDSLYGNNFGSADDPDYRFYNLLEAASLIEGEDYTIDGPESVTLAPGEKQTVSLTITLSWETRAYYLDYFENGAFIEGYVYFDLDDETGVSDRQHLTFLGFYGDWEAQPILSRYDWRDNLTGTRAENDTIPTEAYLIDAGYDAYLYAGDAPFGYPGDNDFNEARISVSPNPEGTFLNAMLVVPAIERNARHIIMIAHSGDTIYYVDDTPYCTKTYYDANNGQWASYAWFLFDGYDSYNGEEPTVIPDDTIVTLDFYANLPIGEDALGAMTPEEILAGGDRYLQYSIPCVVDGALPEFDADFLDFDSETGDLTVLVSDNQFLSAVYVTDLEGNNLDEMQLFADAEPGASHTVTLNVGDAMQFVLGAVDFATNTNERVITRPHEHEWVEGEVITEPACTEPGEQRFICSICGEQKVQTIPAPGHTPGEPVTENHVDPTCTVPGSEDQVIYCTVCGDEISRETVELPAPGHTPGEAVTENHVDPTCTVPGSEDHVIYCSVCGDEISRETVELPAPGHTPGETVVVPVSPSTCVTHGSEEHVISCTVCGEELSRETVELPLRDEADCPGHMFTDMPGRDHWAHEAVDWAIVNHITSGTSPTTFSPDRTVTRAQMITFLWAAAGRPKPALTENPFTDVKPTAYYYKAVLWAVERGITSGKTPTTFGPNDLCNRAQAATFLWAVAGKPEPVLTENPFTDVKPTAYYYKAVLWAYEQGIAEDTSEGTFSPKAACSRAHVVTFLFWASVS